MGARGSAIGRSGKWLSLLLHPHPQRTAGPKDAHVLTAGTDLRESLHSLLEYWLCRYNVQGSEHTRDSVASWSFIIKGTQRGGMSGMCCSKSWYQLGTEARSHSSPLTNSSTPHRISSRPKRKLWNPFLPRSSYRGLEAVEIDPGFGEWW